MTDTQTYQEILDAMGKGGCPICIPVQAAVERYIKGLFDESVLDPEVRARVRASLGLCHEHAWLAQEAGLSDALGLAIVYRELIGALQAGERHPGKECPACLFRSETEERMLHTAIRSIQKNEFLSRMQSSSGFCLNHLNLILAAPESAFRHRVLLDVQNRIWERLELDLSEFIRKNDYRFSSEPIGSESDSYKRAIGVVVGRNRRRRKWDE
jgi:hypothetical protein